MNNTAGAIDVPCSLFAGLNTELAPSDLPEGVSPDNQDVAFLPGSVTSRPALHKVFGTPFPGSPTVVYERTYTQPNGVPLNLYLTSDGKLWKEDVFNSPATYTQIGSVVPGSYASSTTAFGREYIAISDGQHGSDVPLQFDGTYLDRVSQDGPGGSVTIQNFSIAQQALATSGGGLTYTIATAVAGDRISYGHGEDGGFAWTSITYVTTTPHGLTAGQLVSISGTTSTFLNFAAATVQTVIDAVTFKIGCFLDAPYSGTGGTVTTQAPILSRISNIVTATTASAHSLQVGYQIIIAGVSPNNVGGGLASIVRASGIATATTTNPHGFQAGSQVIITGVTGDTGFNSTTTVLEVTSTKSFTYVNGGNDGAGTVAGSNAQDVWNGTYYVASIPSTTTFTYTNLGPNDIATGTGTMTPNGQVAPQNHQCVVIFQTRQGYLTAPGPPVTISANGGQYLAVTNIPIGPDNVIARILAFTGAGGANYFYIPVPAEINGQTVSSSTVIPDNVTTSVVLDFSDNTLFAATAIDVPGNNLFAQVVLGPCLGNFAYASRMFWFGERNKIQNLINMGFEGGYSAATPTLPLGWTNVTAGGTLVAGDFGQAWQITGDGSANKIAELTQDAYQDNLNIAILQPNTQYTFRCWAKATGSLAGSVILDIYSPTGPTVVATATIPTAQMSAVGKFYQADFSVKTGAAIPVDAVFRLYGINQGAGDTVVVDELEVIYTADPYRDALFRGSYVNNPEAFDGVTGVLGAASDPGAIRCCHDIRSSFYFLTTGRLQQTSDNGSGEPSTWVVNEVARDVGALSWRSLTGGEDFMIWASTTGARIFEGGTPFKLSQEIQTLWNNINLGVQQTIWAKNDPVTRRVYFGVPTGTATGPNQLYVMDYRELDSAQQVGSAGPVHVSYTGKMISSDLTRKWSVWNIEAACGEVLTRASNATQFCVGSGNGLAVGGGTGFGNVYYLDAAKYTDDNYGQIVPDYTTYFFINHEAEQALQVGSHRKLFVYLTIFVSGIGKFQVTPLADTLANAWTPTPQYTLSQNQSYDFEWGLNVLAERCAFKFTVSPLTNETDCYFNLNKMVVTLKQSPHDPVRGAI